MYGGGRIVGVYGGNSTVDLVGGYVGGDGGGVLWGGTVGGYGGGVCGGVRNKKCLFDLVFFSKILHTQDNFI